MGEMRTRSLGPGHLYLHVQALPLSCCPGSASCVLRARCSLSVCERQAECRRAQGIGPLWLCSSSRKILMCRVLPCLHWSVSHCQRSLHLKPEPSGQSHRGGARRRASCLRGPSFPPPSSALALSRLSCHVGGPRPSFPGAAVRLCYQEELMGVGRQPATQPGQAHCPASCAPSDQAAAVLPQRQGAGSLGVEREEAAGLLAGRSVPGSSSRRAPVHQPG